MAEITILECDVFKTRYNVEHYTLQLVRHLGNSETLVWSHDKHLSPRAEKRLLRFVQTGMSPPSDRESDVTPKRGESEAPPSDTAGTGPDPAQAERP